MYGFGFGWVAEILGQIAMFFVGLIITVVILGVIIVFVRYLLVATRAAQRYLDTHPAPATTTTPTAPAPPTEPAPTETPAPKPAPRTRAPKTPPAAL